MSSFREGLLREIKMKRQMNGFQIYTLTDLVEILPVLSRQTNPILSVHSAREIESADDISICSIGRTTHS